MARVDAELAGIALSTAGAVVGTAAVAWAVVTVPAETPVEPARAVYGLALVAALAGTLTLALVGRKRATGRGDVATGFAQSAATGFLAAGLAIGLSGLVESPFGWATLLGGVVAFVGSAIVFATAVGPVRERLGLAHPEGDD